MKSVSAFVPHQDVACLCWRCTGLKEFVVVCVSRAVLLVGLAFAAVIGRLSGHFCGQSWVFSRYHALGVVEQVKSVDIFV